jgi:calcineurin-like phosphoesterase family protein
MLKRNSIRLAGICAALLIALTLAASAASEGRIVAIGDVHGDLADFDSILRQTGLTNDKGNWIGGGTVLVQTGDVVDRGPKSRESLDLLMSLERQARKQKGKVIALLGNHEVMAMVGDLRYVSPEDYRGFATERSEKIREEAYQEYLDFAAHYHSGSDAPPNDPTQREKWMQEHPLGFFERSDAFGPQGLYGRWIREHDAVVQIGDVLYLHGGLDPNAPFGSVLELNQEIHAELAAFDSLWQSLSKKKVIWRYMRIEEALRQADGVWKGLQAGGQAPAELKNELEKFLSFPNWLINSPEGPLWYRGLALEPEASLEPSFDAMLERLKAGYIVVGHTPQSDFEINHRFGDRVFLIDTGMLGPVFGGRASALEFRDGRFTAHYAKEKPQALPPPNGNANPSVNSDGSTGGPRP